MPQFILRTGLVSAAIMLAGLPATGRTEDATTADLAGVTTVRIAINQTTPDAMGCGLDLGRLLPVLSDGLRAGGLAVDPAADVTIALTVLTGYDAATGVCATAPMLGTYRRISYFDKAVGWLRSGHVVLWQRGTTATSAIADHDSLVRRAITDLSEALLTSWRSANGGGLANR